MSIVLVIVALLVGAIVVGRELVLVADIRKGISQIDEFQSATYAFKIKYNALPGDIAPAAARNFGFSGRDGNDNNTYRGDGNGAICENITMRPGSPGQAFNECNLFWRHLREADLLGQLRNEDMIFSGGTLHLFMREGTSSYPRPASSQFAPYEGVTPPTPLGCYLLVSPNTMADGAYPIMFGGHILQLTAWATNTGGGGAVPPRIAVQIDAKLDDGMPLTGFVRAYGNNASGAVGAPAAYDPPSSGAAGSANCATNSAVQSYNVGNTSIVRTAQCNLAIKMNF